MQFILSGFRQPRRGNRGRPIGRVREEGDLRPQVAETPEHCPVLRLENGKQGSLHLPGVLLGRRTVR